MTFTRDAALTSLVEAVTEQKLLLDRAKRLTVQSRTLAEVVNNLKIGFMLASVNHLNSTAAISKGVEQSLEAFTACRVELDEILVRSKYNSARVNDLLSVLARFYPEDLETAKEAVRLWLVGGSYATLADTFAACDLKRAKEPVNSHNIKTQRAGATTTAITINKLN